MDERTHSIKNVQGQQKWRSRMIVKAVGVKQIFSIISRRLKLYLKRKVVNRKEEIEILQRMLEMLAENESISS